jgi:hypothetical protein
VAFKTMVEAGTSTWEALARSTDFPVGHQIAAN